MQLYARMVNFYKHNLKYNLYLIFYKLYVHAVINAVDFR